MNYNWTAAIICELQHANHVFLHAAIWILQKHGMAKTSMKQWKYKYAQLGLANMLRHQFESIETWAQLGHSTMFEMNVAKPSGNSSFDGQPGIAGFAYRC